MKLGKSILESLNDGVTLPSPNNFTLPEKVLQFGTGVLLRGLPDYYIDKANRNGVFNGRIVVVKSTSQGDISDFEQQDFLYTLSVRGIEKGCKIEEDIICSSISRVLNANSEWEDILNIAANPSLEIIISNTTEVGIELVEDDIYTYPPISFPGKLLSVLYHRYKMYNGAKDRGLVIIPTELISGNGDKLQEVLLGLAEQNKLELPFIEWMQKYNYICNSLVDRIVPGKPSQNSLKELETKLGYEDQLLTISEAYNLWAIEGDDRIKEKLTFAQVNKGIVITPDISLHKELKLRLLNGTHTLSCAVALLSGFQTVKQAMDDPAMEAFISQLMKSEIASAIPYGVSESIAHEFSDRVLDRFRNPHIDHQWLNIAMNYTSKLNMRVLPVLLKYLNRHNEVPELIAFAFAAFIDLMKPIAEGGKYYTFVNGDKLLLNDDKAAYIANLWKDHNDSTIVNAVLQNRQIWEQDLSVYVGFKKSVETHYRNIQSSSVKTLLNILVANKLAY